MKGKGKEGSERGKGGGTRGKGRERVIPVLVFPPTSCPDWSTPVQCGTQA